MSHKIIVTGGAGYIGSHVVVELAQSGYDVVCFDSMERADPVIWENVQEIAERQIPLEIVDLTDYTATTKALKKHKDALAVIHLAAYKLVPESVKEPLKYFHNNVTGLINLLRGLEQFGITRFLFSSSCSVYGNPDGLPVSESDPFKEAESPYARTKQIAEFILKDISKHTKKWNIVSLRYFNPVGAHPSHKIGEALVGPPENLFPRLMLAVAGRLPHLTIYGDDYPTVDGTPVRDYIHIVDLAKVHVRALNWLITNRPSFEVFNIGTGTGLSVLQVIKAFEESTGLSVPYTIGKRRHGDVVAVYASGEKAEQVLNWRPSRTVHQMVKDAWNWHLYMEKTPHFRRRLDTQFPVLDPERFKKTVSQK